MKAIISRSVLAVSILLMVSSVLAQDGGDTGKSTKAIGGFRAEIIDQIDAARDKFVALAEATPQEKYPWRPAKGVRSINEVFTHIAQANFFLPGVIGIRPPAGTPSSFRAITDRAEVAEQLKLSFAFVRGTVEKMSDEDLEKKADFFGRQRTYREIYIFMTAHFNQHLGQSIAYSRMNGITPPWSR